MAKIKLSKKDRASQIETLRLDLQDGQGLTFVVCSSKPYDWKVLYTPIKGHINGNIQNISLPVSACLGRSSGADFLRGFKYDSPELIGKELQTLLGFQVPFGVQVL